MDPVDVLVEQMDENTRYKFERFQETYDNDSMQHPRLRQVDGCFEYWRLLLTAKGVRSMRMFWRAFKHGGLDLFVMKEPFPDGNMCLRQLPNSALIFVGDGMWPELELVVLHNAFDPKDVTPLARGHKALWTKCKDKLKRGKKNGGRNSHRILMFGYHNSCGHRHREYSHPAHYQAAAYNMAAREAGVFEHWVPGLVSAAADGCRPEDATDDELSYTYIDRTPFTDKSLTANYWAPPHHDKNDAPGSFVTWYEWSTSGKVYGGDFAVYSLGCKIAPRPGTMVYLNTVKHQHGTMECFATGNALRLGTALFVKPRVVRAGVAMRRMRIAADKEAVVLTGQEQGPVYTAVYNAQLDAKFKAAAKAPKA